jgi:two-component system cell cycle response regulator DivK
VSLPRLRTSVRNTLPICSLFPPTVCYESRLSAPDLRPSLVVTSPSNETTNTVLLVEDNEDNRIIYATALRYAGYHVLEAITGTEGLHKARTELPGVILMDISVPELDGWEATTILKADPATAHIIIVAVTAHALPGDEERSRNAGCDGYLAKPISPALLVAEVDRRFGRTSPSYHPRG